MATVNVLNSVDAKLREELSPTIMELLGPTDEIFNKIIRTSMGVERDRGIGRDFKVIHTMVVSTAGVFEWRAAGGSTMETAPLDKAVDATTTQMGSAFVLDPDNIKAFPAATDAVNPGLIQRNLTLVQGSGNMTFPMQLATCDQLSSSILKYIATSIKLVGKQVAHQKAISFYSSASYNSMGAVASSTITTDNIIDFTISGGRIARFIPGMLVDFYDVATGATRRNGSQNCIVQRVDLLNKTLRVVTTAGGTGLANVIDTDVVVPRNSVSLGPSGLEDWIVKTGSIFGVSTSTQPQLKSIVEAYASSLTSTQLDKFFGSFDDAYGGFVDLDTIITTGGVTREYAAQQEDLGQYQRQGAALNLQGGFSKVGYECNGKNLVWHQSRFCTSGTLYGIKLNQGNIKTYIPPRIPSSGKQSGFPGDVEFFAPLAGSKNVFMASHASGAVTELLQCPFFLHEEIAPEYPQSIKITGLTESNATLT